MKKFFYFALCMILGFVACKKETPVDEQAGKEEVKVTVTLDMTQVELKVGESVSLTATVTPDLDVEWESGNEAVAVVSEEGTVTAVAVGEAVITASAGNVKAECQVTVGAVEVTDVQLDLGECALLVGETLQLTATVSPDNATDKTVVWETTDEAVARVDQNGLVTAAGAGEAVITATSGGLFAVCNISVALPAVKGDYYYSDGTYSSDLDTSKEPIGIVFWTGDPTATDLTLKKDFPGCCHGLVIALDEIRNVFWQKACRTYNSTVTAWVESNNLDFLPLVSGIELEDPLNKVMGYNNTKAIEAFNAAEENAAWPVDALATLDEYRRNVPAPATSSDWYLPSIKELNLAFSGDYPYSITDFDNESTEVCDLINSKLQAIPGAIKYDEDYMSSTEKDALNIYDMMVWAWYVPVEGVGKGAGITFRPVLAF